MTTITRPDQAAAQAHAGATGTERAAQLAAAPKAQVIRGRVLHLVATHPDGLTATEAFDAYEQAHGELFGGLYSLAPRLSELLKGGFVRKGETRERRVAYVITVKGAAWVQETGAVAA